MVGFGNGAGEGNRTLTASLEGWNSTVELHPLTTTKKILRCFSRLRLEDNSYLNSLTKWWRRQDLNLRTLARTDLQSVAIDHSATSPHEKQIYFFKRARLSKRSQFESQMEQTPHCEFFFKITFRKSFFRKSETKILPTRLSPIPKISLTVVVA